jgi:hypothetical protein
MARLRSPKSKGDTYERELAAYLNVRLFDGREIVTRTPLSGGGRSWGILKGGDSDLTGLPGLHVEAKRTERFTPYEAMAQAIRSITSRPHSSDIPVVVTRRNRMPTGESLVVLRLDDFLPLLALLYGVAVSEPPHEKQGRPEAHQARPERNQGDPGQALPHAPSRPSE